MKRTSISLFQLCPESLALCLQKCVKGKSLRPGKQVHTILLTSGMNMNILSLNSRLVGMYASCGDMRSANYMLGKIQNPNVFALNWMILSSAFNGYYEDAIRYFSLMRELGHTGNKFTFSIVLKACVGLMDLNKGREVHAVIIKVDFQNFVSSANSLIDMYAKCGRISYARHIFDRMGDRDVASWTSMICGYCNVEKIGLALVLFERMKLERLEPNDFTWNVMMAAYARSGDSHQAFALLARSTRDGFVPDLVTWNALISGFTQSHKLMEAFKCFRDMLVSGIQPNHVTLTVLLTACGLTGSVQRGREIHGFIYRNWLGNNVFVASALIDMYSKCGSLKEARSVFDWIPNKNIASWNAMIGCYGKWGMVDSSIKLFEKMKEKGIQANAVTFICVLSACSHSGLVEKGLEIFRSMRESYKIEISKEHYACVVDLLCRAGKMVEAYEFLRDMPIGVTESILGAFFNGCKIHGRRDLASMMVEDIMRMKLIKPGGFVALSNIYAAEGEWEEVENIRNVMKDREVHKSPGFSWFEMKGGFRSVEEEKENKFSSGAGIHYRML
ncbi:Pentatricopeptide repeat-containing protein [Quillaja saponaria]|uniref:Pentatricopeptide repeat-containing protein n=1 Tax=Quillaja saponaria TaxID=32244 RepID=A0AAD7M5Q1_QUISA|nr:Pentatricopeptide repeat-containing protein [Quillaja saponaria]